jgi:2-C-methyl-D-erythritol 2,4-cyclodiphosphate synthase
MRERIAEAAGIEIGQVSVKATTTEHLGFEGEEKGVSATSVVLLVKSY